jgi:iron complex outermembrane receptor protein
MSKLITRSVRCGLAAAAAMLSMPAAQAQQAPPVTAPAAAGSLEEVLVTARRREESMQEVPIAVSAFSADELRMLQAEDLSGLQGSVPNLNLVQGRGSANSANIYIRGIGQPDALQTFDPGVGVYLDDVYIARIQGALFNLYDVQRVEVLRGPQGTLYGKNTIAGAIRLISKKPPEELAGQAEVSYGDYDYFSAKGYLGGPVTDNFGASVAGVYVTRSGINVDPATDREYNDIDTAAGRVILEWDPTENVNVNFAADYTRSRNELNLGRPEAPLVSVNLVPGIPPKVLQPAPTTPWNNTVATSFTGNEGQQMDNWGTALTVGWQLNDAWLLKSITAYRSLEPDNYVDIDASIYELGDVFVGVDQDQTSQEFQLLYSSDRLEAVMGLYYFGEDIKSDQTAWADDFLKLGAIPITFTRTVNDKLNTDSYAAFGQATYRFTDRWSGTLGIRYTDESKDYFRTTTTFFGAPLQAAGTTFEYKDDESWTAWTPTIAVDYRLTDETLLYASATEGFKSGGFNGRANTPGETGSYDPEFVWTYEIGAKNTLADGRLRLNADVFYSDYTDFQARVSDVVDPDAPIPTFSFPVLNAGSMEMYGAELEATWIPIDELNLQAQIGYLHADYREFTASTVIAGKPVEIDRSDENPPFAPEWTARLAVAYTFNLAENGGLTLSADMLYRDKQWLSVDNRDVLTQDSYALMNVLVSWASASNHWYGSAGIKNLTDEVYKVDAQEFSSVGNIQTAYYGDPQTWQVIAGYRF